MLACICWNGTMFEYESWAKLTHSTFKMIMYRRNGINNYIKISDESHFNSRLFPADRGAYELDDPQESYDDIEPGPEITQTQAEVHNSPRASSESGAVAPSGLVQEVEDYLVPDRTG